MRELLFDFFGYVIFFYSLGLIFSYVLMMISSGKRIFKGTDSSLVSGYERELINNCPYTIGVSIVAPAYNEEKTIVDNIKSLLEQDYPLFEVVIVNDGSKDETLERIIENFGMEEVPYAYVEKVHAQPFRRLFKSRLDEYRRLTVVDKENGGTKADAVNAGLNVARFPYFINTDVDCILSQEAIRNCIMPVMKDESVIAVSGAMTMSNGCKVENGRLLNHKASWNPVPLFQTLEYMRSFFIGKMAWSNIKGMPNVSGGYGLFNTEVMIAAGGYSFDSMAEDMDMLLNAIRYCCEFNRPYSIVQIPYTCCWTEAPSNLKILYRQRSRWGRGLFQTFARHFTVLFKSKYHVHGLVTMPYLFIFEFLAPIIEATGFFVFLYLAFTGGVNWVGALIIFLAIYTFSMLVAFCTQAFDFVAGSTFDKKREYFKTSLAAIFEPFLYHPFITAFSLVGYGKYLLRTRSQWGTMTRKGYSQSQSEDSDSVASVITNTAPST